MTAQPGFFDIDERLRELSSKGDDLERLERLVDFELFRADLEKIVARADRSKGGRPPFDHVLMFKVDTWTPLKTSEVSHLRTVDSHRMRLRVVDVSLSRVEGRLHQARRALFHRLDRICGCRFDLRNHRSDRKEGRLA
jgi:hypothetical protein